MLLPQLDVAKKILQNARKLFGYPVASDILKAQCYKHQASPFSVSSLTIGELSHLHWRDTALWQLVCLRDQPVWNILDPAIGIKYQRFQTPITRYKKNKTPPSEIRSRTSHEMHTILSGSIPERTVAWRSEC